MSERLIEPEKAYYTVDVKDVPSPAHIDIYITKELEIDRNAKVPKLVNEIQERAIRIPGGYECLVCIQGDNLKNLSATIWVSDTNENYWTWKEGNP